MCVKPLESQEPFDCLQGQPCERSWLPNEEGHATTDMESDQPHVPAFFRTVDQAVTPLSCKVLMSSADVNVRCHLSCRITIIDFEP